METSRVYAGGLIRAGWILRLVEPGNYLLDKRPAPMEPVPTNDPAVTEEHRALIALSMITRIGPGRIRSLVARFGSAQAVLDASTPALISTGGIGAQTASAIRQFDAFDAVDDQLLRAERAEARLITWWDAVYPERLRVIFDAPALLWVLGDAGTLAAPSVAIVGTRKPTAYGKRVAAYFASALVEHGFAIVSGLAYGIDAEAHRAALEAGGCSIAVLGSGVDRIYPAAHRGIARDLMLQGALVSEFPLQARPDAVNFPRRNRIISGLTRGTLVAEAFESGGALITARLAFEQDREVFAAPGSIFDDHAKGCHQLVQSGQARLVHSVEDLLEELGVHQVPSEPTNKAANRSGLMDLNAVERTLYDVLTEVPMQIDAICDKAELDVSSALVYLLSLEFKGLVCQMAGKHFYRAR